MLLKGYQLKRYWKEYTLHCRGIDLHGTISGYCTVLLLKTLDALKIFPLSVRYCILSIFFFTAFLIVPSKRTAVRKNLQVIFGRKPRHSDVLKVFLSYGRYWAESADIVSLWRHLPRRYYGIDPAELPRHMLGLTFHIGNFELFGPEYHHSTGTPFTAVAEHLKPSFVSSYFIKKRGRYHIDTVLHDNRKSILSVLEQGKTLGIVCDRMVGGRGMETRLFHRRIHMPLSILSYAISKKIPIFLGYFIHDNGILKCYFHKITSDSVDAALSQITGHLEHAITMYPYEWHVLSPVFND